MPTNDHLSDEPLPTALVSAPPERAGAVFRVAAALVGLCALLVASLLTAGGAFVAIVGMVVAYSIAKRRQRPLTRAASWVGAVGASGVAIFIVASLTFYLMPNGTVAAMKHSYDSTMAVSRSAPPPPWVERMAPGSTARANARPFAAHPAIERGFTVWMGAMSGVMIWAMTSIFIGTAGWLCGLLLAFALTGSWLPRGATLGAAR
jgi:hypothetical protein